MMTSFTEDLSNELSIINSIAVDKKGKLKVFEKIFKFCQNHATAKQLRQQFFLIRFCIFLNEFLMNDEFIFFRLVDDFTKAYKRIILFFFLWCTITTAGALLVIRIEIVEKYQF